MTWRKVPARSSIRLNFFTISWAYSLRNPLCSMLCAIFWLVVSIHQFLLPLVWCSNLNQEYPTYGVPSFLFRCSASLWFACNDTRIPELCLKVYSLPRKFVEKTVTWTHDEDVYVVAWSRQLTFLANKSCGALSHGNNVCQCICCNAIIHQAVKLNQNKNVNARFLLCQWNFSTDWHLGATHVECFLHQWQHLMTVYRKILVHFTHCCSVCWSLPWMLVFDFFEVLGEYDGYSLSRQRGAVHLSSTKGKWDFLPCFRTKLPLDKKFNAPRHHCERQSDSFQSSKIIKHSPIIVQSNLQRCWQSFDTWPRGSNTVRQQRGVLNPYCNVEFSASFNGVSDSPPACMCRPVLLLFGSATAPQNKLWRNQNDSSNVFAVSNKHRLLAFLCRCRIHSSTSDRVRMLTFCTIHSALPDVLPTVWPFPIAGMSLWKSNSQMRGRIEVTTLENSVNVQLLQYRLFMLQSMLGISSFTFSTTKR